MMLKRLRQMCSSRGIKDESIIKLSEIWYLDLHYMALGITTDAYEVAIELLQCCFGPI